MTERRSRIGFLLAILIAGIGIVSAQAPTPGAAATPAQPNTAPAQPTIPRTLDVPDGALIAAGKTPELDMLYTGDVIGYIEPCG